MSKKSTQTAKVPPRMTGAFLPLLKRRRMLHILKTADLQAISPKELAQDFGASSPTAIARLWRRLERQGDRLLQTGKIHEARRQALSGLLRKCDPLTLSESLSPYHPLLWEQACYRSSDAATRLLLRRSIERFSRHHRLPPESAAILWKGEAAPISRIPALVLLLPFPLTALFAAWMASLLSPIGVAVMLTALPAVFCGGYLLTAAVLQKALPSSPLPLLQNGAGHSLLTVGVGSVEHADSALDGMARIAAGGSGCAYLLLLTLPDHVVCEAAGEAEQIAVLQKKVDALAERLEISLSLLIAPRHYDIRKKRWIGKPTFGELSSLIAVHTETSAQSYEAVCILPADATILPGSGERLAAALFHPLCKADALVFLLPAASPLPKARLYTLRQCLLQKLDAPADLPGWGIYRTESLKAGGEQTPISPRLVAQPLFSKDGEETAPYAPPLRQTPSLLPTLRLLLPALRPILLWGMIAARLPISACLLLWLAASADLMASALLSLRLGRRFYLYTLPAWKRLGKAWLYRTLLPVSGIWTALGKNNLGGLCLLSLFFGSAVIAVSAPLSFLGLCWCITPLLLAELPERSALSANRKAACHALATKLYGLLPQSEHLLLPSYLTQEGERAPYTTPAVMGARLAAEISACDLGLIDSHTLEWRVNALLTQMEKLPTRGGLPYARYAMETGDYYKDSHIDTADCGIYALCLSAAEAGLAEYAVDQPGLYASAERVARLSAQMDFSLLLREDRTLCRTLTPEGEQEGELSYLFDGGISLFAALSSDSTAELGGGEKNAAWQRLRSPALLHKGHCSIASERGLLMDYLLPALLLPTPADSLLAFGKEAAVRAVLREAKRADRPAFSAFFAELAHKIHKICKKLCSFPRSTPFVQQTSFSKSQRNALLIGRQIFDILPPLAAGSKVLCKGKTDSHEAVTAPLLCMLLEHRPRLALSHLQRLQESDPTDGFADPLHPQQIPLKGVCLGLIALAGAITEKRLADRLMTLPRCGALYPFLCRRPDSAVEGASPLTSSAPAKAEEAAPPSVCLLGNASHGLLIAKGWGISLWEGSIPLTAPNPVNQLLTGGRPSGLLLFREGKLLPMPSRIHRREAGLFTLCGEELTCRIQRSDSGWSLCWERTDTAPLEARFLFCPQSKSDLRLSEERITAADGTNLLCLCMEYSATLTIVIAAERLSNAFTHADPSPFPRGREQIPSILRLTPLSADGWMSTPSCIIGGGFADKTFELHIVSALNKAAALRQLTDPASADSGERRELPLPLPTPDGSLAARVLEWQIASLFAGMPIPSAMATGSDSSNAAHLERCLQGGKGLLMGKGFPAADHAPMPLTVSRREGAEALLTRLLSTAPTAGETSLLPAKGQIHHPHGFPEILRGRDLPALSRTYHNGIATLIADPEMPRLRLSVAGEDMPFHLYLCRNERTALLPAAATEVRYSPAEAVFSGDGFTLRMALLPKLPLLSLRLIAEGDARLTLPTLPEPHKAEGEDSFWYTAQEKVLFCRRLSEGDETIFLVGWFPRAHDHLYYWIRERVTIPSLPRIVEDYGRSLESAAAFLCIEDENASPLPSLAAAVMGSDSPARALLSPLLTPHDSTAHLMRLAMGESTLLLPMALLIHIAVTDDYQISDLRLPVAGGRASLYFIAARSLERAMDEDDNNPLLPPIVNAFARLAEEIGDHDGLAHYSDFQPKAHTPDLETGNSLPHVSARTVELLSALLLGKGEAAQAVEAAIRALPIDPNPFDAALLWCGVLWGVLGFIPHRDGFTLAPIGVEKEMRLRLSYKGRWQIRLSPDAPPLCYRGDLPLKDQPQTEEKIFRNPNISHQNRCILERNGVK